MPESFKYGDPVKANVGGKKQLAFVTGGPHDVQGADGPEQKYKVTTLDGNETDMAFTAEKDFGGGYFSHG